MAVVDELVTLIGYKLDERGAATLKAAKSEVVDMAKKVAALSVAVIAGKTAFQGWFSGVLENSMQLQRLSDDTNTSAQALQSWGYAVGRMGGDAKGALSNLQSFQRGLHSVIPGQGNFALKFFVPEFNQNTDLEQSLTLLAEKFKKMIAKDPVNGKLDAFRTANAVGLNDDNARLLMKGREGVLEMMNQFKALNGGVGTDKQVKQNAELWQSFYDLKTSVSGYAMQLSSKLTPYIKDVIDWTNEWIKKNRELHATQIELAAQKISDSPKQAKGWWESLKDSIENVGNAEIGWFESLKSHYPHITAWIKDIGALIKGSFTLDFDIFGRMWAGIKTDGAKIMSFLSDMGDAVAKIFKSGGWLFDKFLQFFGIGYDGKGFGQATPDDKKNIPNADYWKTQIGANAQALYQPQQSVIVPSVSNHQSATNNYNQIDMRIDGSKHPVETGRAVSGALSSYLLNPVRSY